MANKKNLQAAGRGRKSPCSSLMPLEPLAPLELEHRYPLAPAAESLARLQWDLDHAGGFYGLASQLGLDRQELLAHRWTLKGLAPMQQGVAHG